MPFPCLPPPLPLPYCHMMHHYQCTHLLKVRLRFPQYLSIVHASPPHSCYGCDVDVTDLQQANIVMPSAPSLAMPIILAFMSCMQISHFIFRCVSDCKESKTASDDAVSAYTVCMNSSSHKSDWMCVRLERVKDFIRWCGLSIHCACELQQSQVWLNVC